MPRGAHPRASRSRRNEGGRLPPGRTACGRPAASCGPSGTRGPWGMMRGRWLGGEGVGWVGGVDGWHVARVGGVACGSGGVGGIQIPPAARAGQSRRTESWVTPSAIQPSIQHSQTSHVAHRTRHGRSTGLLHMEVGREQGGSYSSMRFCSGVKGPRNVCGRWGEAVMRG